MGFIFSRIARKDCQGGVRFALIALSCLVMSFVASILMVLGIVYQYSSTESAAAISDSLNSDFFGLVIQALLNGLAMTLLSWLADVIVRKLNSQGDNSALMAVFCNWMIAVAAMVFMVTSAVAFSVTTVQAENTHKEAMFSEVDYLKQKLESPNGEQVDTVLEGYSVPIDGTVVIMDDTGTVLASDNEEWFAPGDDFLQRIGYPGPDDIGTYISNFLNTAAQTKAYAIDAFDAQGNWTMAFTFAAFSPYDGGYIGILRSADMVYANRFSVMASMMALAIALIASISLLATVLLDRVVVRRIDETNASLGKITDGDLDERVHARNSREFVSLSVGINTTVSALKDTIEEVKHRNAQDLATAKTIQESALPRDFPPFPHIDQFDIYASMKTAKEVGGDFYDFFLIGEKEEQLGFIMADVSGKGIPAALFMMTAKTQIKNYMEAGLSLGDAVAAANHQLCIGNDAGMFVTMYACVLDYETGLLSYVNAGHNPPLLLHEGRWDWIRDLSGVPLGLFDGLPYTEYAHQLDKGDMLYLYTDGVTEALNVDKQLFGDDRLEETLRGLTTMNARSVCNGIRCALTDYTVGAEQSDDITMLCLKYGVAPEKKAVIVLRAVDAQLVHVNEFLHEELLRRGAPKVVYGQIDAAIEELFDSVCRHAYPQATPDEPGEVRVGFEYDPALPALFVSITDNGVPYNPLEASGDTTSEDAEGAPVEGAGVAKARQNVDEMSYERVDGSNVVTLMKKW